jgi:hypothetical protein
VLLRKSAWNSSSETIRCLLSLCNRGQLGERVLAGGQVVVLDTSSSIVSSQ